MPLDVASEVHAEELRFVLPRLDEEGRRIFDKAVHLPLLSLLGVDIELYTRGPGDPTFGWSTRAYIDLDKRGPDRVNQTLTGLT